MTDTRMLRLVQSEALELARCRYADEPCGTCLACQCAVLFAELDLPWKPN